MIDFNSFDLNNISDESIAAYIDGNATAEEILQVEYAASKDLDIAEIIDISKDFEETNSDYSLNCVNDNETIDASMETEEYNGFSLDHNELAADCLSTGLLGAVFDDIDGFEFENLNSDDISTDFDAQDDIL